MKKNTQVDVRGFSPPGGEGKLLLAPFVLAAFIVIVFYLIGW